MATVAFVWMGWTTASTDFLLVISGNAWVKEVVGDEIHSDMNSIGYILLLRDNTIVEMKRCQ